MKFFTNGGFRNFDRKNNPLVESSESFNYEIFENLNNSNSKSFTSISDLQTYFLTNYENGFDGQSYKNKERKYKEKAHFLTTDLLGYYVYTELLEKMSLMKL